MQVFLWLCKGLGSVRGQLCECMCIIGHRNRHIPFLVVLTFHRYCVILRHHSVRFSSDIVKSGQDSNKIDKIERSGRADSWPSQEAMQGTQTVFKSSEIFALHLSLSPRSGQCIVTS